MKKQRFSILKRLQSFTHAFNGLKIAIREEHNVRIHLLAIVCVSIAGVYFRISALEWIAVVLAIGLVVGLELLNSSIECMADFISPEKHDMIKKIKDLSAAGVLLGAIAALIIGLIIFLPKLLAL